MIRSRMFEGFFHWVQLGMQTAALTISVLTWLFLQFPRGRVAALGQWLARVPQAAMVVATYGLGRTFVRTCAASSFGSLVALVLCWDVEPAVAVGLTYLFFGMPVFTALEVLRLCEVPRENLSRIVVEVREELLAEKRKRCDP